MIRNETEYQQAVTRLEAERQRLDEHVQAWEAEGFTAREIERLRAPLESFHMQLEEEVQSYERLKRGHFSEFENLHGLGQVLIGVRIARGMTQRELARKLGVDESAVSRDERNEYHGITVERAMRVLDAMGVRLMTRVEVEPMQEAGEPEMTPEPA